MWCTDILLQKSIRLENLHQVSLIKKKIRLILSYICY